MIHILAINNYDLAFLPCPSLSSPYMWHKFYQFLHLHTQKMAAWRRGHVIIILIPPADPTRFRSWGETARPE